MQINFQKVLSGDDLGMTEILAKEIWKEHYTPIIGEKQVAYMLEKFQSVEAMTAQINEGYHYFLIKDNDSPVGYLSYQKRDDQLFLSKIYVRKDSRGKGFGKMTMKFVMDEARKNACAKVSLTVNKYNYDSIKAYESIGFMKIKALVQDIGEGYVMDDYYMEIEL